MNVRGFDAVARDYDATWTDTRLGRALRGRVWRHMSSIAAPGQHVLELGCGTGEDALWMARRGIDVVAVDASAAMLSVAERKLAATTLCDRVTLRQVDLATNASVALLADPQCKFDGAFSNFGVLNCLPDRRALARQLARAIRPGGWLVLVMMGPLCPWEIGWYLLHGERHSAFRRWHRGIAAHAGNGSTLPVWYPTPYRLRREFAPYFRHRSTTGIGVWLPPSYLREVVERRPRLYQTLASLEERSGGTKLQSWLNDHYLAVFERT